MTSDPSVASVRISLTSAKFADLSFDRYSDKIFHALGRHSRKSRGHHGCADDDNRIFALRKIGIKTEPQDQKHEHGCDGETRSPQPEARECVQCAILLPGGA